MSRDSNSRTVAAGRDIVVISARDEMRRDQRYALQIDACSIAPSNMLIKLA